MLAVNAAVCFGVFWHKTSRCHPHVNAYPYHFGSKACGRICVATFGVYGRPRSLRTSATIGLPLLSSGSPSSEELMHTLGHLTYGCLFALGALRGW
jgi:hypothetical protein